MKIMLISTSHNSMSQRAYVELADRGHDVFVQLATSDEEIKEAVQRYKPELIVAPFLKTAIPEEVWKKHTCIIVHPGIKGDRGPSSLDRAIMDEQEEWGVTLLQADTEMDAGDIWATRHFPMRAAAKSTLYRHEVTQAAMAALLETVEKFASKRFQPEPLNYANPDVRGRLHSPIKQVERKIDWNEPTETIVKKIRAADSSPGVLDSISGEEVFLYGAHEEDRLTGRPGEMIAKRGGAICRATGDGAVWITHLKRRGQFKLPANLVLKEQLDEIPEVKVSPFDRIEGKTYREIFYEEKNGVGYLNFDFYNGAMSTEQCEQLREAYIQAKSANTKVIVLMGGQDFWSNGIHLNVIEHADDPADESWRNINAIDDLVREIILTDTHLTISAMQGNAGAGGVILALAADRVVARNGIVLNPHYKKMGGLYGSEYWTYLLPKRVGRDKALQLTNECQPLSTSMAMKIGLIEESFGETTSEFVQKVQELAEKMANHPDFARLLEVKKVQRQLDESRKSLEKYREEELINMWYNFYGNDKSYHTARHNFVNKVSCVRQTVQ